MQTQSDGLELLLGLIYLAVIVGAVLLRYFLFRRLGIPGWKAFVPYLSDATVLGAGGFNGLLVLLQLSIVGVPVLVVLILMAQYRIGRGLGMNPVLNVAGLVLGFWPIAALVVSGPYDHRRAGVTCQQPDMQDAIAYGGLIDPTYELAPAQTYPTAPQPARASAFAEMTGFDHTAWPEDDSPGRNVGRPAGYSDSYFPPQQ